MLAESFHIGIVLWISQIRKDSLTLCYVVIASDDRQLRRKCRRRSSVSDWLLARHKSSTNIAASEDFSKKLSVILSSSIRHDILVLIHIELKKLSIFEKKTQNLTTKEAKI